MTGFPLTNSTRMRPNAAITPARTALSHRSSRRERPTCSRAIAHPTWYRLGWAKPEDPHPLAPVPPLARHSPFPCLCASTVCQRNTWNRERQDVLIRNQGATVIARMVDPDRSGNVTATITTRVREGARVGGEGDAHGEMAAHAAGDGDCSDFLYPRLRLRHPVSAALSPAARHSRDGPCHLLGGVAGGEQRDRDGLRLTGLGGAG